MAKHQHFPIDGHDGTTIIVHGDPNMSDKTKEALVALAEAAENHVMTQQYGPNWRELFPPENQPEHH